MPVVLTAIKKVQPVPLLVNVQSDAVAAFKDETVVKYSILNDNKQLFATKYMLFLPTEAELIAEIEREKLLIGIEK